MDNTLFIGEFPVGTIFLLDFQLPRFDYQRVSYNEHLVEHAEPTHTHNIHIIYVYIYIYVFIYIKVYGMAWCRPNNQTECSTKKNAWEGRLCLIFIYFTWWSLMDAGWPWTDWDKSISLGVKTLFRLGLRLIWGWFRVHFGFVEFLLGAGLKRIYSWVRVSLGVVEGWFILCLKLV